MAAPISRGKQAMITADTLQLNEKPITNAVTVSDTFCTIVERRSARVLRTKVASAAKVDVSEPVLFSSKSNQPISLQRIAAFETKESFRSTKLHNQGLKVALIYNSPILLIVDSIHCLDCSSYK